MADIEALGVNAVSDLIAITDILSPFFNRGDKEPCWDGDIYVYKSKQKGKNGVERIPVQIKGVTNTDLSSSEISYPVELSDLRAYLKNGGAIFFVVYCHHDNPLERRVYFNRLWPIDLKKIITEKGKQKQTNIQFKPFPVNKGSIETTCLNFLMHAARQKWINEETPLPSIAELENNKSIVNYEFLPELANADHYDNPIRPLLESPSMLYAICDNGISYPVKYGQISETEQEIKHEVAVGADIFYTQYKLITKKDEQLIKIGQSIAIIMDGNNKFQTFTVNINGSLSERVKDAEFIIRAYENKSFRIGSIDIPFSLSCNPNDGLNIQELKEHYDYLKELNRLLDKLNSRDDLDYDKMNEDDFKNVSMLLSGILKNRQLKFKSDMPPLARVKIGNLEFLIYFVKQKDCGYKIFDFATNEFPCKAEKDDKVAYLPRFAFLEKEDYISISNLDFNDIFDNIVLVAEVNDQANRGFFCDEITDRIVIRILLAYDEKQNAALLDCVTKICAWLLEQGNDKIIAQLNYLQCVKRSRSLNDCEKETLITIAENSDPQYRAAAHILLDSYDIADLLLKKLEMEEFEKFMSWPIAVFLKNRA